MENYSCKQAALSVIIPPFFFLLLLVFVKGSEKTAEWLQYFSMLEQKCENYITNLSGFSSHLCLSKLDL